MTISKVTIIDYGVGNLLSVQRGFEHFGAEVTITSEPQIILASTKVVLPGVGAFANAMQALGNLNLIPVLHEVANRKIPLLGICLGMQLMLDESEEFGVNKGLGLISGKVIPVPKHDSAGNVQKIPHIGWNVLRKPTEANTWDGTLLADIGNNDSAYFVHSYMSVPNNPNHIIAECLYGGQSIPAVISKDNITACQFHPEKSGEVGLKILQRFLC